MFNSQVDLKHYLFDTYVPKSRWNSFWYQLTEVLNSMPHKLLIIGTGDGVISTLLTNMVECVKTLDVDPDFSPNYCCSVTELSNFCEEKFDSILCCQVLEHLPLDQFDTCLYELSIATNNLCIISLPQKYYFSFSLSLSLLWRTIPFNFVWCKKNVSHKFDGQHHWEIGARGASLSEIKSHMRKYFKIRKTFTVPENPYHRFFGLEKYSSYEKA